MTTRIFSLDSLRSLASSARRGHLAGSSGSFSLAAERDLDRVAGHLLAVAQADPERLSAATAAPVAAPVDLGAHRARAARQVPATAPAAARPSAQHAEHAQAS
ncbi:hypothetical protein [Terrabacter sp. 2RAF25]|uniref:hypothetical protein n=1 Tax=Terrabacter sp. 2RAF25 TaxID=3232998 RepID=UPI003F9D74B8